MRRSVIIYSIDYFSPCRFFLGSRDIGAEHCAGTVSKISARDSIASCAFIEGLLHLVKFDQSCLDDLSWQLSILSELMGDNLTLYLNAQVLRNSIGASGNTQDVGDTQQSICFS